MSSPHWNLFLKQPTKASYSLAATGLEKEENYLFREFFPSMHAGVHVINEHGKLQGHPWRRCRKSNSDFAQAGECGNDTLALWNW